MLIFVWIIHLLHWFDKQKLNKFGTIYFSLISIVHFLYSLRFNCSMICCKFSRMLISNEFWFIFQFALTKIISIHCEDISDRNILLIWFYCVSIHHYNSFKISNTVQYRTVHACNLFIYSSPATSYVAFRMFSCLKGLFQ